MWGLACSPYHEQAVLRLLWLKRRNWRQGLIVVAARLEQLQHWLAVATPELQKLQQPAAITWVVPATANAPLLVRGDGNTVAVRVTRHPLLQALCAEAGPLVSTSANISGTAPIHGRHAVRCILGRKIDMVVAGDTGGLAGSTEIRELLTGKVLRAAVPRKS